ncbi:MAG: hypothetical protein AAFZ15_34230 [Bacteroidota bacterium]
MKISIKKSTSKPTVFTSFNALDTNEQLLIKGGTDSIIIEDLTEG